MNVEYNNRQRKFKLSSVAYGEAFELVTGINESAICIRLPRFDNAMLAYICDIVSEDDSLWHAYITGDASLVYYVTDGRIAFVDNHIMVEPLNIKLVVNR